MRKLIILITLVMVLLAATGCEVSHETSTEAILLNQSMEKISELGIN